MKLFPCIVLFLVWSLLAWGSNPTSIGIFTSSTAYTKPWDPDSVHTGITGSEEAVIYLSQELSKLNYQVTVIGNPPESSPYTALDANPRYIPPYDHEILQFDIAIAWRLPKDAKRLKLYAPRVYLWPHDTCPEPLRDEDISAFDDILWLSEWQRQQWISQTPSCQAYTHIFGNGINENQFPPLGEKRNPYACIWGSNYGRGLEILLTIWPAVKHRFPQATLDIYYGWQHWGLLSQEKEFQLRQQIERLYRLNVREHGLVSHEVLHTAYANASLWTYPCTAPETFCISALKAQMCGVIPVIIDGSALGETVPFGFHAPTAQAYLSKLLEAMSTVESCPLQERQKMRDWVLNNYTWRHIANKWSEVFLERSSDKKAAMNMKAS